MRCRTDGSGIRYYHHKDHLGSTIGVTDDTGSLVWKSDYEPYGLQRNSWQKTTGMNSLIRHRYTDQEFDAETGLYNYNARLYDPSIARFISPDTIVDNPYSSLALNRYMYVAGNPLRYTDPSGHLKIGKFFKRAVGSSVSTVMDDWLGIEYARGGYFNVVGVEVGFDFRNNGVEMSVGVGVGEGLYVSVGTPNIDFNYGYCKSATVGYDTRGGTYASASYYFGQYHASARYYFRSGYYSVGGGASSGGYGVNVGYARGGGFSVGGSVKGYGLSYNLKSGRVRGSVDVTRQVDRYMIDMQVDQASGQTGPLLAMDDIAATWAAIGRGGMNGVAIDVYHSDPYIDPCLMPYILGATVGIISRNASYGYAAYEWADAFRGVFMDNNSAGIPHIPIDPLINPPAAY